MSMFWLDGECRLVSPSNGRPARAELTFSIGELFDLEALACTCQELQRWSFFVTSAPLNMPGGVSSPPNAMAIF